ncbi:MAG: hypothetical protein AB202_01195 [Parcubacteria bacterium C7867-007]|nr:MAG: hypothetical protein AB202_01195 [Parcubacteria bacterium C7867-007]
MALPKGLASNGMSGVTLIELLMVLGLITAITTFAAPVSISNFERLLAHTDPERTVAILRHARAQGMHGNERSIEWNESVHTLNNQPAKAVDDGESYVLSAHTRSEIDGRISFPVENLESSIQFTYGSSTWRLSIGELGAISFQNAL